MTGMGKPTMRILHNLARSGGTVIGKCLGCMKNVYLLSEIHPQGSNRFNPIKQAHDWHGLLDQETISEISKQGGISFPEAIRIIDLECRKRDGYLVLRDWAHLDFMAVPFLPEPRYYFLLEEVLKSSFDLRQFAIVRHPVDEWLSLRKLAILNGKLNLDAYMEGYFRFAEHAVRIGYVRYEDFTKEPEKIMKQLCDMLQIDFDPDFIHQWHDYDKITGDVRQSSRGSKLRQIVPLKRAPMESGLLEKFHNNRHYMKSLELLGYADVSR